jgi:hypothetical protein
MLLKSFGSLAPCAMLAALLLVSGAPDASAAPPGPTVSAATPSEGEQGTLGLEVVIDGNGFEEGSNAVFLRSGTADPTGIAVLSTEYVSRKQVRARLDIAEDAPLDLYDIEIQSANGRKGKGTELFGVLAKGSGGTGGDPVMPGAVLDPVVLAVDSTTIDARWTETADDGYDPASGPAYRYRVKYRTDTYPTRENWNDEGTHHVLDVWAQTPGEPLETRLRYFPPATLIHLGVETEDASGHLSPVNGFGPVTTLPFPPFSLGKRRNRLLPVPGGWGRPTSTPRAAPGSSTCVTRGRSAGAWEGD